MYDGILCIPYVGVTQYNVNHKNHVDTHTGGGIHTCASSHDLYTVILLPKLCYCFQDATVTAGFGRGVCCRLTGTVRELTPTTM